MEDFKLEHIQIRPESIRSVLVALDEAIEKHTEMKAILERLLRLQGGSAAGPRRRGRPPKSASSASAASGPRRRRRSGGGKTLREAIIDVLEREGKPIAPKVLTQMVLDGGYKTKAKPNSFYTAVFNAARKEPAVENIGGAFVLVGNGVSSPSSTGGAKKKRRKTAKKRGKVAKKRGGRRKAKKTSGKKGAAV